MADDNILQGIRYTAAMASLRGTYQYISDICDDVPVRTEVDYWRSMPMPNAYRSYGSSNEPRPFPLNSRPRSAPCKYKHRKADDQYHERCLPQEKFQNQPVQQPLTAKELKAADVITSDKIWKESVGNEQKGLKQWEDTWSFLTKYDQMGRPRQKEPIPYETNRFSSGPVTNTNGANYGSRLGTNHGKLIQNLEYSLGTQNRKKKQDSEMVCY